jgi:hypothetical protein
LPARQAATNVTPPRTSHMIFSIAAFFQSAMAGVTRGFASH